LIYYKGKLIYYIGKVVKYKDNNRCPKKSIGGEKCKLNSTYNTSVAGNGCEIEIVCGKND
jgi:hypothetical protein